MANPIISEDGHFVWNGTEWIPNEKISEVNIADSVITVPYTHLTLPTILLV